jgi:hypothetical protein
MEGCFESSKKVFTRFDHGSTEQMSREFHLDGLSGDVRRNIWQLETYESLATG